MPPYWARQRCHVDSAISRCRHTSLSSRPAPRSLLPSAILRMIWSGLCRRRLFDAMSLLILPCPQTGQQSPTTTGPLRRAHHTGGSRRRVCRAHVRCPVSLQLAVFAIGLAVFGVGHRLLLRSVVRDVCLEPVCQRPHTRSPLVPIPLRRLLRRRTPVHHQPNTSTDKPDRSKRRATPSDKPNGLTPH